MISGSQEFGFSNSDIEGDFELGYLHQSLTYYQTDQFRNIILVLSAITTIVVVLLVLLCWVLTRHKTVVKHLNLSVVER